MASKDPAEFINYDTLMTNAYIRSHSLHDIISEIKSSFNGYEEMDIFELAVVSSNFTEP